jgi:hypothetical protein
MTYAEANIPDPVGFETARVPLKSVFTSKRSERREYVSSVKKYNEEATAFNTEIEKAKKQVDVYNQEVDKWNTKGRFQEIDFIERDFTGYALRYFFKARAYQKAYPIYLGGELKKKFFNKINSGTKFYTTKDVTINDFLPQVQEKFSELSQAEVKRLILHGFRRMHSAIKYGCAISIQTKKFFNCIAHIGALYLKPEKQIREYSVRRDRKLRKIEG